ncbi:MAG: HNH endonuclease [Bacteroidota bacterium]
MYAVTSCGDVISYRFNKEKILKQQTNTSGYKQVSLICADGSREFKLVHRLVAKYFIQGFNENLTVHHIDYNKTNNKLDNLCLMSFSENTKDAAKSFRMGKKLTKEQVVSIKRRLGECKQSVLAKEFGVSEATISYIKSGVFWNHLKVL